MVWDAAAAGFRAESSGYGGSVGRRRNSAQELASLILPEKIASREPHSEDEGQPHGSVLNYSIRP